MNRALIPTRHPEAERADYEALLREPETDRATLRGALSRLTLGEAARYVAALAILTAWLALALGGAR